MKLHPACEDKMCRAGSECECWIPPDGDEEWAILCRDCKEYNKGR